MCSSDLLQIEYSRLASAKTPFNTAIVWAILSAVAAVALALVTKLMFLFALLIFSAYFAIKAIIYKNKTNKINRDRFQQMRTIKARIEFLTGEIDKLEGALLKGNGTI